MSQQLQITGGAKVRNLEGVLTGTSGVVNALGINVPSGIPQLDGSGKILVSQLPNSVMEYKGSWNAATNTPTLVNGTGNAGDVYLCEVAGTVNFGAGPITFAVGDQVIYSGTIWQRASGATGTVTSVAVSRDGDALTITGSPITTSGTINLGFSGSNAQYINGEGDLVTFPSLTGFVPYTGATSSVDLGTNSIGANTFLALGNGTSGGFISFTQTGTLAGISTGVASIGSVTAGQLSFYYGNNLFASIFSNTSLTADRTFTFPDLSGTLALLEGTQTFSGYKTFDAALELKYNIIPTPSSVGNSGIGSNGLGITITTKPVSTVYNNNLYFQSSSNTYTFPASSGTIALTSDLSGYVPYTGATANVNLGTFDLRANVLTGTIGSFSSNSSSYTVAINQTSGSGIALNIQKSGNGEGLYINKASGSGNAATIIGTLNATTLVKNGGTSSQFLKADGSVDSNSYVTIDTTQTISGVKTFSASVVNDDGLKIKFGSSPNLTASYLTLSAFGETGSFPDATILRLGISATDVALLRFPNTTSYQYTFPASTGTVALTSDLSGYVTIGTTQTITGAKTFSLDILVNSVKIGNANGSILNTVVGFGALTGTGVENTAVGYLTLSNNTTGNGNTAVGKRALINNTTANYNTAIGAESLFSNTTGSNNTGVGYYSLFGNTTGVFNTALGSGALSSNTTGVSNTAIGANSLLVNTTGNNNTAIGTDSLNVNTTGSRNTAIGYYALNANTIANNNTAIGYYTLVNNTTGGENLGVGNEALRFNTVGDNNVAVGNQSQRLNVSGSFNTTMGVGSLYNNTTGTYNIAIGYNSATSITTGSNNTIIGGYVGTAAMSNNIVLSDGAGNVRYQWDGTNTLLGQSGNVGIGTSSPAAKLDVNSGGTSGNSFSAVFSDNTTNKNAIAFSHSNNNSRIYATYLAATGSDQDLSFWTTLANSNQFERMRITSGGNVGIGTSSPSGKLSLYDTSDLWLNIARGSSFVNIGVDSTGTFYNTNSNHRWLYNSGSNEAMRIIANGNVGIGTSSPSARLHVVGGDFNIYGFFDTPTSGYGYIGFLTNGNAYGYLGQASALISGGSDTDFTLRSQNNLLFLSGGGSERMRITSGGNVVIGSSLTAPTGGETGWWLRATNRAYYSSTTEALTCNRYGSTGTVLTFDYGGSGVGNISTNGSTVTFSGLAISDARYKENIEPITNALDDINQIDFVTFKYKENGQNSAGVTAQQLETIKSLSKFVINGIDEESYKAVDYYAIIGYLGKAIQELKAEIDELKNK